MESPARRKNGKTLPWCGNTRSRFRRKNRLKTKCCGGKRKRAYNININICCGNKLFSKRLYGCCGNVKYRKSTHQCCGINKIILRSRPCNTRNRRKPSPIRYISCGKTKRLLRKYGRFTKCCGAGVFHSSKSICCDGTIQPLRYGILTGCCRKKIYNMRLRKCCRNGKIVLRHSTCTQATCAGRHYNPRRQICCGSSSGGKQTLKFKIFGTKTRCCGNNVYNPERKKCCVSTVHNRPAFRINKIILRSRPCNTCNRNNYSPRSYICCRKTIPRRRIYGVFTRCCGARVFHSSRSICCYGTIKPLRYGNLTKCCRRKIYNLRFRKCCRNGKNVLRIFTCTTCAGQHYNPKRQICCRSSGGKQTLKSNNFGTKTRCCGNNVYNPELQTCCFSTVHNQPALSRKWKCCGGNIYNSNVDRCCRGRVILPKSYSCVACALKNFYDPRQDICCRGIIYRRRYGLASSCCVKNLYDKKIQRCCSDGTLIPSGNSYSLPLCGNQPYNETSHICCDGHAVLPRIFGSKTGCCVFNSTRSIYHIQQQKCCFGKPILSVEPCFPDGINCTEDMDVSRYICCGEMKHLKPYGYNTDCCGNHVYDRAHELCCDGNPSPIQAGKNYQCCGEYSYESGVAQCCAGNIVIPMCGTCPKPE